MYDTYIVRENPETRVSAGLAVHFLHNTPSSILTIRSRCFAASEGSRMRMPSCMSA